MRPAALTVLAATLLLGSCATAPPAVCAQLASVLPEGISVVLAMFLGLVSAQSHVFGFGLGVLMAVYAGWIDVDISMKAGCGIGFCRILATLLSIFADWFGGAAWGFALKFAQPWLQLVGGAFAGLVGFVIGAGFAHRSC